jgi:hypothetical protein
MLVLRFYMIDSLCRSVGGAVADKSGLRIGHVRE